MAQYPQPKTEQDYEYLCLEFLRAHWKRPNLVLYAKRGEEQLGVDIIDQEQPLDLHAAQCKLHESSKTIPPAEIKSEVKKALAFDPPILLYAICTTAKKSKHAQKCVLDINASHAKSNKFRVVLFYWEDIERFLDQHPDLWEKLNVTSASSVRTVFREESKINNTLLTDSILSGIASSGLGFDRDLDRAKELLNAHNYDAAAAILQDLRAKAFDRLSPLQRYRCLANLGAIENVRGNTKSWARLLLDACSAYPEHEKAPASRAMALRTLGRLDEAWEQAQKAVALRHPAEPDAVGVFIACAPPEMSVEAILSATGVESPSDPQVLSALADRYAQSRRYTEAIAAARRIEKDPRYTAYASLTIGQALLANEAPEDLREAKILPLNVSRLREALAAFATSASAAETNNWTLLAIEARLHQIDAATLLGDDDALESAIMEGLRIAHRHPEAKSRFLLARSQLRTNHGDYRRAFDDANAAVESTPNLPDGAIIREFCRRNLGDKSSREQARREMAKLLATAPRQFLDQGLDLVIRECVAQSAWDDAVQAVEIAEANGLIPTMGPAYRALILWERGNRDEAKASIRLAVAKADEDTPRVIIERLGRILLQFELFSEAADLLEQIACRTQLTETTRMFLHCAQKAEQHKRILEWCESLRESGVQDRGLLGLEIGLQQRYDPEKALQRVESALAADPDDRRMRVLRAHLARLLVRTELMRLTPDDIPSASEVELPFVNPIVSYLDESGFAFEAVDYAYRCIHRFPGDQEAHSAVIRSLLLAPNQSLKLDPPAAVTADCAVEFQEDLSTDSKWFLVDDSLPLAFSEASFTDVKHSNDSIICLLLGHKPGDQLVISRGAAGSRTVTIKSLKNKYLYRLHDVIQRSEYRFPGRSMLEQVKLDTNATSGHLDLDPILRAFSASEESRRSFDDAYRTGFVSIGLMAERNNRSVFDVMQHLSMEPALFVNCVHATPPIFHAALQSLRSCSGLVLDATAIGTLRALHLEDVLGRMPKPLGYAPALLQTLLSQARSPSHEAESVGSMVKVGERLVLLTRTPEDIETERNRWSRTLEVLQSKGVLMTAAALAALSPEQRENLVRLVTEEPSQAMAAASGAAFVLWTDDNVCGFLGQEHFHLTRVWTQVVLAWLAEQRIITPEEYRLVGVRLTALQYSGVATDMDVLVAAGRLAGWDSRSLIIQRNLIQVARGDSSQICFDRLARYCLAVYKEIELEPVRSELVIQSLETIKFRPDLGPLARALTSFLTQQLQMSPLRGDEANRVIATWLRSRRSSL